MGLPLVSPATLECRNLAELLLRGRSGSDPQEPALFGTIGERYVRVERGRFRSVVLDLAGALADRGLRPGETVCLLRLPRTSELVIAVAYAALTAAGFRVLLPMYSDPLGLRSWLGATNARTLLWSAKEVHDGDNEADRLRFQSLERQIGELDVSSLCLSDDLGLPERLLDAGASGLSPSDSRQQALMANGDIEAECLVLTTAGTSGKSKLVRYTQGAFLRSCASWEAAGMLEASRLGGRGLCLLFSHSMGVRAFWNAIWTGQPLCLIPPEWFLEHPERVRALLLQMRPMHVIGGPAVYRALLELARVFPDLKEQAFSSLRCAVSCGAPFDKDLARRLDAALGVELHNAFGTTETMLVLSTLVDGHSGAGGLGGALPGVQIATEPAGDADGPARLLVHSPFGCAGYVNPAGGQPTDPFPYWYATGDLVEQTADGLRYVGREDDEFIKDGFGVKLTRRVIDERYARLGDPVTHVEWFPLRDEPGLAALVYVEGSHPPVDADGALPDRRLHDRVGALLETRHETLQLEIDDFELRHLTIARFACLAGSPPRTSKGNVSRAAIEQRHRALLGDLLGRYVARPGIARVDRDRTIQSSSTRLTRPRLGRTLQLLRLDKDYVSGRGDRLAYFEKGQRHEVADFVGGFGATLLGHRHPEIVEAAQRFLDGEAVPFADQGSDRPVEGAFARRLAREVGRHTGGSYVVRLGSTGAEAVEMALAHAMLERDGRLRRFVRDQQRMFGGSRPDRVTEIVRSAHEEVDRSTPVVLAIAGSFHGHSLGARTVSELRRSRKIFAPMARLETIFLPPDGRVDLDSIVREADITMPALAWRDGEVAEATIRFSRVICAIAEPIRGEGGVEVASSELLARLARYEFPLIIDEIQCGLGRSGQFLASHPVRGHYYLLGKSLGGGVAKISATLIDRARYVERFDEYYAGTFAGDAFSCTVASAVLDVIERDDIACRARDRGAEIARRLDRIRHDFPTVVSGVRGAGLMLGVDLAPAAAAESVILRMAMEREWLGLLASTYLLNRWHVRVLPTLSAPNTLRVEPSAYVDDGAIKALDKGLRAFCGAVAECQLFEVLSVLVDQDSTPGVACEPEPPLPAFLGRIEPPAPGAVRVAFINHFVFPDREVAFVEPSLCRLAPPARRELFNRLTGLMDLKPPVLFGRNLFGGRVWFASILLPADAATLEEMHRSGKQRLIVQRIQEALTFSRQLGCTVGALGGFTSIVTEDGTALVPPPGMRLSTGNALTVAVGVRRLLDECRCQGIDPTGAGTRLGILGATGNIGSALAHALASGRSPFRCVTLVGRRPDALEELAGRIRAIAGGQSEIDVSTDLSALRNCNVIAAATGTNEPLLYPRHLPATGSVIVADVSVPSVVAASTRELRHIHVVPLAGTVAVPGTPDFAMAAHIAPGTAFSCAGESMLLALAPEMTADLSLVGPVERHSVEVLDQLAVQWGLFDDIGGAGRHGDES